MTGAGVERRMAAVLVADVVGYSRLMEADETGTLAALKALRRELIDPFISDHGGRIVKVTGDGMLAEFASVVDAVTCAVAIQRESASRNGPVDEDRRIRFRVGINLGDIIHDGGDIFGDGVNIAARLEAIAEPGGICVSGAAFDHLKSNVDVGYEFLGEQPVKNIAKPVRIYRVLLTPDDAGKIIDGRTRAPRRWRWAAVAAGALVIVAAAAVWLVLSAPSVEPASLARMAYPLPSKPSLAVLPFSTLAGEDGDGSLANGLTESIVSALSRSSKMFVIDADSTVTYKGRKVSVRQVAEELGVRYVLEGSVQRSGDRLRVTARLADALTGYQVWSERYDRAARDFFALQDEITFNVVTGLQVKLTDGEMARTRGRGTENLDAWLLANQSMEVFQRFTSADNERARALATQAIALDPDYSDAYVRLARAHLTDYQAGWVRNRAAAFKKSVELVTKALDLDENNPDAYNLLGSIYLYIRRHDDALAYSRRAVELSPSYAIAKANLGMAETYSGHAEQAVATIKGAMRLSPFYPAWFLKELGRAYFHLGRTDEAISALEASLLRDAKDGDAQILMAASLSAAGRMEEAREIVEKFRTDRPNYTLRHYAQGEFYRDPNALQRVLEALGRAGMPR